MLMNWLAEIVCGLQSDGEDLVMVTLLSKTGSAPCLAGTRMVVRTNGKSIGTVGGGALEAAVQNMAAWVLKSRLAEIMSFNLTGEDAASMQMTCGGKVKLLVDYIPASEQNGEMFRKLRDALHSAEKCYLIASLGSVTAEKRQTIHCLALEDGTVTGEFPHPQQWLDQLIEKSSRSTCPVVETIDDQLFVIERCYIPSTVYIYGAGHVSQQVALMAEMVGFRTVILDDRSEFANRERFPKADAVKVLGSFHNCFAGFEPDGDSYVVIVTRGHHHDKTVLTQALRTKAGYIGMMGSKRKRVELFKSLEQEGFSREQLEKVHSPIGLEINASTISEIAVSIVAELIQTRGKAAS